MLKEDWSHQDTHKLLTQYGYKKNEKGPFSPKPKYNHPEGHEVTIDHTMYKHVQPNGLTTNGHVTNLPVAMRQLHKQPSHSEHGLRFYEDEEIYGPENKNDADDRMTDTDITKRFDNDKAFDKGDWGDTQKKFVPGPTYEGWNPMKNLLEEVIKEAQTFDPKHTKHTEDPITDCAVCGKGGHVPAKHFGKALSGENNQPVTEREVGVTKPVKEDVAEKCPDCHKLHAPTVPCPAKKVLFGDELPEGEVKEGMKFSRQHGTEAEANKHCESLKKQGVKAWVNKAPDGVHHTFWMQEETELDEGKKQKKFDKTAHIKAIARNTVGQVPKGQVIVPKDQRKKPKHKVDWMKRMDEACGIRE